MIYPSEWQTTSTILEELRDREAKNAWDLFVGHFRDPILRFARRAGLSHDESKDATQEVLLTFVEALRGGKYEKGRGRLSHWLFGIARRQVSSHARKRNARERDRVELRSGVEGADLESVWQEEWHGAILKRSLRQVKRNVAPRTFRIFEEVVLRREPTDVVAARHGVSRDIVYRSKHRVTRRLRELMSEFEDA